MPPTIRLLFTLLPLMATGCSYNPFSSDNHLTGKPVGAAVGGTLGAGTAALAKASQTGIALMAVGGAAVGYYVTTLDFKSGGIKRAGGEVLTQGDCVTIVLPTASLFEDNTATLKPEATPALSSTIDVLNDFPDNDILIAGNSSGYDTRKYEKNLTQRRAQEISAYFWAHNVNECQSNRLKSRKLLVVGNGYRFPVANSLTATGIYTNSRIQISSCPSPADLNAGPQSDEMNNIGRLRKSQTDPITQGQVDYLPPLAEHTTERFQPPIHDKQTVGGDLKHEKPATYKEMTVLE